MRARSGDHQLPGGMTGTFRAQLAEHGMEDRFDAVLRRDYPIRHPIDELVALALDRQHVRRLTIRSGEMTVDLRR